MKKASYFTTFTGHFQDVFQHAGTEYQLNPEEAKYHVLAGTLTTEKPKPRKNSKVTLDAADGD